MAMPATVSEVGPCKKLVKVTVPQDRVKKEIEKNYHELSHNLTLPGFRRGRVPRSLIEKRFGKHVAEDVKQSLVQETLGEAIEEAKLQPIGEPKLDPEKLLFDPAKDPALEFEATVSVRPEFQVPDLASIRVVREVRPVTDDDLRESFEQSRRARGELRPKAEGATVGPEDFVMAEIEYLVDGASVHKHEGHPFWVRNNRLDHGVEAPDLAGKLASAKIGDAAEFELDLDQSFPEEAARGKKATVRVAVKEIKEVKVPDLDDEFAKEAGFETLADLKDEVRQRLLRQADERAEAEVEEKALEAALAGAPFDIPGDMVDQELDELALRAQLRAKYMGASEEDAAAEAGRVRSASRAEVEHRLKGVFLLDRIAREHKVFATEDEIDGAVRAIAARQGRPVAEVREELEQEEKLGHLRFDLKMDKARKWLRSKVEVVDAENK